MRRRMVFKIVLVSLIPLLGGCQSWEWQEPIPQYAITSCLQSQGEPVYSGHGNRSEFRCIFPRNLDARYFDDSRLLDPHFKPGEAKYDGKSDYVIVPVDEYFNESKGVVVKPYKGFNRE